MRPKIVSGKNQVFVTKSVENKSFKTGVVSYLIVVVITVFDNCNLKTFIDVLIH